MATPLSTTPWQVSSFTGDAYVDSILGGTQWAVRTLTFSFPDYDSVFSTSPTLGYGPTTAVRNEPWSVSFEPLRQSDRAAVVDALASWSAVADIRFAKSADTEKVVGDLRFAFTSDTKFQAHAYLPFDGPKAGDVWVSAENSSHSEIWTKGSYSFQTIIHEIGHAIGLKHPFEAVAANGTTIDPAFDSRSFTIMSYSSEPGVKGTQFSYEPTTPMMLDILAVQALYGPNTKHHAGNDNYVFRGGEYYHQTIWDGGGSDTITYKSSTGGEIDLNAGSGGGSQVGQRINALTHEGQVLHDVYNVWLAFGTVIENAVGGSGNDVILGNEVRNHLEGGRGNDVISGGAGKDSLYGGAGNDLLGAGAGSDKLSGGAGADRFVLDSRSGSDAIADFAHRSDKIVVGQADLGILIGDGDAKIEGAVARKSAGGFSELAELVIFTSDMKGGFSATKAAAAIGSAKHAYDKGDTALFVVDNGDDSAIYLFASSSANAGVSAKELTLLATLDEAPSTSAGDYLFLV